MTRYIIKRLLSVIPIIFIVTLAIFVIMYFTPGSPASSLLGMEASSQQIAEFNQRLGLDQPFLAQYGSWLGNALRGDLGDSFFMNMSVTQAIYEYMIPTISLALFAIILSVVFGLSLGLISVYFRGKIIDRLIIFLNLIGQATPSFIISMILLILFAVIYRIFPVAGYRSISDGLLEHLKYIFLPGVSISIGQTALIARMTRSSLLEVIDENYILTGRMKGISEGMLLLKHALKNAFLPILTVIGQGLGTLLSGTIVVETIFSIPGLGQLLMNSIQRRDYAVIQGVILVISAVYILVNLLIDITYTVVDPRIVYTDTES